MAFSDFHGNSETVLSIREMLARERFPHAVILSGPAGSGKYTLATMFARAANCLKQPNTDGLPDFCGECSNCIRIAQIKNLELPPPETLAARTVLNKPHTNKNPLSPP